MDSGSLPLFDWARNNEYIGAVCWAIWNSDAGAFCTHEALVDTEDFERLKHHAWRIGKVGKKRKLRVVRGRGVYLAREIMGFPPGLIVDHKDRNSLNDRRANLRPCTVAENNLNREQYPSARSRFKGVAWNPSTKNWQVYAGRRGQKVMVGRFSDEVEAARAYNAFARQHYDPFAYLNPV